MKFGSKKLHKYSLGVKSGANSVGKFGQKHAMEIGAVAGAVGMLSGATEAAMGIQAAAILASAGSSVLEKATR
tara:strand:+ start:853 stop:1071 length:219 start_codon:yes stop_codon:yes gene_type:complete